MKIIQKFDSTEIPSIDKGLIGRSLKGKWSDWKRTFFLQNPVDGKIALVSLNLFERIGATLQKILCFKTYSKFKTVFKKVKVISASTLLQTPKKVDENGSVQGSKPRDNKTPSMIHAEESDKDALREKDGSKPGPLETGEDHNPFEEEPLQAKSKEESDKDLSAKEEQLKQESIQNPPGENTALPPQVIQFEKIEKLLKEGNLSEAIKENGKLSGDSEVVKNANYLKIISGYIKQGKYEEALELSDSLPPDEPLKAHYMSEIIVKYIELKKLDEALRLNEKLPADHVSKENHYILIIKGYIELKNFEKALELNEQLSKLFSGKEKENHYALIVQGYLEENKFQEALGVHEKLPKDHPSRKGNDPLIFTSISKGLVEEDKLEEALKINKSLPPEEKLAQLCQIIIKLIDSGKLQRALEVNGSLPPNEKKNSNYIQIAKAYLRIGDSAGMLQAFKQGDISWEIRHPLIKDFALGVCRTGHYDVACSFLQGVYGVEFASKTVEVFQALGNEYLQNKNYAKAFEVISHIKGYPGSNEGNERVYIKIAEWYLEEKKLDKADEFINKIDTSAEINRLSLILLDKYFEKKDFENGIGLNIRIAENYRDQGEKDQALAILEKALKYLKDGQKSILEGFLKVKKLDEAIDFLYTC